MSNSDRHVSTVMMGVRLKVDKAEEIKRRCAKGKLSINQWITRAIDQQLRKR